jgi:hypothetical protein
MGKPAEPLAWPAIYEIKVKGCLDSEHWSRWFDGMALTVGADGVTTLRGPVDDLSALYGLLSRLRDLALLLLSVNRIESSYPEE